MILLSDGYIANGSEPWCLPDVDSLPDISVPFATEMNHIDDDGTTEFWPYLRDPETLARPWAIPGTPGLMHRVGGLEKEDGTRRHQLHAGEPPADGRTCVPRRSPASPTTSRRPTIVGDARRRRLRPRLGLDVGGDRRRGAAHPPCAARRSPGSTSPTSTRCRRTSASCCSGSRRCIVPELNLGQLCRIVRAEYLVDAKSVTKVQGLPFTARELEDAIEGGAAMSDTIVPITTKKDWTSDQEVRWCPGCGDYGILLAVQQLMPELGIAPENTVFVSGIGCSSRFPYYMNTYGMHSIHGRAPAIATGVAVARPDLDVWVITGDGDGLSIGGNHLIHALRRNVNLTILLFNNRIYGLTKGQYSPTSEMGKVTKSTPFGSIDPPFNPLSVALGAEASRSSPAPTTSTAST